jgi:hypothetical protein
MKTEARSRRRPDKGLRRLRTNVAGIDLGAREHWVCGPPKRTGTGTWRRSGPRPRSSNASRDG